MPVSLHNMMAKLESERRYRIEDKAAQLITEEMT